MRSKYTRDSESYGQYGFLWLIALFANVLLLFVIYDLPHLANLLPNLESKILLLNSFPFAISRVTLVSV